MNRAQITIIHGPQACGKTRNAESFRKVFGRKHIIDDWDGSEALAVGDLVLTNWPEPTYPSPLVEVFTYAEACDIARGRGVQIL